MAAKFTAKIRRVKLRSMVSSPFALSRNHVIRSSLRHFNFLENSEIDYTHRFLMSLLFSFLSTGMDYRCKVSQAMFNAFRDHRDQRIDNTFN